MIRNARYPALCAAALLGLAGPLAAADRGGYSVSVLVDGAPVAEYGARGRIYVEALKGREFVLRLSNPTSDRIAVALSVDGRNVIDAKRTTAAEAAKWVLGPGETLDVPGWQVSGRTSRRFFFTETSSSYAKWLGDTSNVGTIEAVFYREKRRPPAVTRKDEAFPLPEAGAPQAPQPGDSQAGAAGADEPERRQKSSSAPTSPSPSLSQKESDSYAATGIGAQTEFPVEWTAFEPEKSPSARIALRYEFRAELVRLGVLPRADDLFARDRAHGFAHDYAPDPYRR